MKKVWNFILKNRIYIVLVLFILFFAFVFVTMKAYLDPVDANAVYGNRLDGIENYVITDEVISKIKEDIIALEKVIDLNYHLEGRLANFIMTVENDLDITDAKNYASKILEYLSDDIKGYYDIQIYIDSNVESDVYPIIGTKHKTSDLIF